MREQPNILHLDLDAFFAAVEQRDKPSLRGRPVIVGGLGPRGVVSTASYEARQYGVHSAMSMAEARRRCPQATYLSPRFAAYREASRIVMDILREVSPRVEPLSLDEAYVDLADSTFDAPARPPADPAGRAGRAATPTGPGWRATDDPGPLPAEVGDAACAGAPDDPEHGGRAGGPGDARAVRGAGAPGDARGPGEPGHGGWIGGPGGARDLGHGGSGSLATGSGVGGWTGGPGDAGESGQGGRAGGPGGARDLGHGGPGSLAAEVGDGRWSGGPGDTGGAGFGGRAGGPGHAGGAGFGGPGHAGGAGFGGPGHAGGWGAGGKRGRLDRAGVVEVGGELKRRILAATGLTASVGAGTSKLIAKIASDLRKPDGLVVVPPGDERDLLRPMPVGRIPGVGRATAERLAGAGVRTIADLEGLSELELTGLLGSAHGRGLYRLARAEDDRIVEPDGEAKSISVEDTFDRDVTDPRTLRDTSDRMAVRVAERLRDTGLAARTVTVKVRLFDFSTHTRSSTLPSATDEPSVVVRLARQLLADVDTSDGARLLGVGVAGLVTTGAQPELWVDDVELPTANDDDEPRRLHVGQDVTHTELGAGWLVQVAERRLVVRFETRATGPGPTRSFSPDDPALRAGRP